jgi:hypothetical protein
MIEIDIGYEYSANVKSGVPTDDLFYQLTRTEI